MNSTMMNYPLSTHHLIRRASEQFPDVEVVTQRADKTTKRHTWSEMYTRSKQLAKALQQAGLQKGDRVATLMWNNHAHVEAYFGVPMAKGIYHTLNIRLAPQDIIFIANHGEDRFLIVDDTLLPLYLGIKDHCKFERVFVVEDAGVECPEGCESYEEFLASSGDVSDWEPELPDENDPIGMCYTSGTTGRPKGVIYSHRSMVLHSFVSTMMDTFAISMNDTVLPVVPQFHVNAWGLPFTAAMVGAKMVLPGPHLHPAPLLDLISNEKVTFAAGVPTIWLGIQQCLDQEPERWDYVKGIRMVVGGAAAPAGLIKGLDKHQMRVIQGWGMTETTPLGTVSTVKPIVEDLPEDEHYKLRAKQGFPAPFVNIRGVNEDGFIPWDGKTMGELQVQGPWVAASYYRPDNPEEAAQRWSDDGYFSTGDVVTIDPNGYVKITDRTKDLIKSGGEWISSVDLENELMGHPDVLEAAVVGVPHPKWSERPVAAIVFKEGKNVDKETFDEYLKDRVAKFWIPDHYVAVEEIPKTSTGKFLKSKLRETLNAMGLESTK